LFIAVLHVYYRQNCWAISEDTASMAHSDSVFEQYCTSGDDSVLLTITSLELHLA
jgi:hypothetical protein